MSLDTIPLALDAIAHGRMVVVMDDDDLGHLVLAAEFATPRAIGFIGRWSSGFCVALPPQRVEALRLPPMVGRTPALGAAFRVSVDFSDGTTTGCSAADRALTAQALVDPEATAAEFRRPGHVVPLRAVPEGVLRRPGPTEAAVDLTRLARLEPGGVLAEIVGEDGSVARGPQLPAFAQRHGLPLVTIAGLVAYRRRTERIAEHGSKLQLPGQSRGLDVGSL